MSDPLLTGRAIFSTNLGSKPPRLLVPPLPPVILRSAPERSAADVVKLLRDDFPKESYGVFPYFSLADYYDPYDIHVQGPHFLSYVLGLLAHQNLRLVVEFAHSWSIEHANILPTLCNPVDIHTVFDESIRARYDPGFLIVALRHMRDALAAVAHHQLKAKEAEVRKTSKAPVHAAQEKKIGLDERAPGAGEGFPRSRFHIRPATERPSQADNKPNKNLEMQKSHESPGMLCNRPRSYNSHSAGSGFGKNMQNGSLNNPAMPDKRAVSDQYPMSAQRARAFRNVSARVANIKYSNGNRSHKNFQARGAYGPPGAPNANQPFPPHAMAQGQWGGPAQGMSRLPSQEQLQEPMQVPLVVQGYRRLSDNSREYVDSVPLVHGTAHLLAAGLGYRLPMDPSLVCDSSTYGVPSLRAGQVVEQVDRRMHNNGHREHSRSQGQGQSSNMASSSSGAAKGPNGYHVPPQSGDVRNMTSQAWSGAMPAMNREGTELFGRPDNRRTSDNHGWPPSIPPKHSFQASDATDERLGNARRSSMSSTAGHMKTVRPQSTSGSSENPSSSVQSQPTDIATSISAEPFPAVSPPPHAMAQGNMSQETMGIEVKSNWSKMPDYQVARYSIGQKRCDVRQVWVTGFEEGATVGDLELVFRSCGTIEKISLSSGKRVGETRAAKPYAWLTFEDVDGARNALRLQGNFVKGYRLQVEVPQKFWTELEFPLSRYMRRDTSSTSSDCLDRARSDSATAQYRRLPNSDFMMPKSVWMSKGFARDAVESQAMANAIRAAQLTDLNAGNGANDPSQEVTRHGRSSHSSSRHNHQISVVEDSAQRIAQGEELLQTPGGGDRNGKEDEQISPNMSSKKKWKGKKKAGGKSVASTPESATPRGNQRSPSAVRSVERSVYTPSTKSLEPNHNTVIATPSKTHLTELQVRKLRVSGGGGVPEDTTTPHNPKIENNFSDTEATPTAIMRDSSVVSLPSENTSADRQQVQSHAAKDSSSEEDNNHGAGSSVRRVEACPASTVHRANEDSKSDNGYFSVPQASRYAQRGQTEIISLPASPCYSEETTVASDKVDKGKAPADTLVSNPITAESMPPHETPEADEDVKIEKAIESPQTLVASPEGDEHVNTEKDVDTAKVMTAPSEESQAPAIPETQPDHANNEAPSELSVQETDVNDQAKTDFKVNGGSTSKTAQKQPPKDTGSIHPFARQNQPKKQQPKKKKGTIKGKPKAKETDVQVTKSDAADKQRVTSSQIDKDDDHVKVHKDATPDDRKVDPSDTKLKGKEVKRLENEVPADRKINSIQATRPQEGVEAFAHEAPALTQVNLDRMNMEWNEGKYHQNKVGNDQNFSKGNIREEHTVQSSGNSIFAAGGSDAVAVRTESEFAHFSSYAKLPLQPPPEIAESEASTVRLDDGLEPQSSPMSMYEDAVTDIAGPKTPDPYLSPGLPAEKKPRLSSGKAAVNKNLKSETEVGAKGTDAARSEKSQVIIVGEPEVRPAESRKVVLLIFSPKETESGDAASTAKESEGTTSKAKKKYQKKKAAAKRKKELERQAEAGPSKSNTGASLTPGSNDRATTTSDDRTDSKYAGTPPSTEGSEGDAASRKIPDSHPANQQIEAKIIKAMLSNSGIDGSGRKSSESFALKYSKAPRLKGLRICYELRLMEISIDTSTIRELAPAHLKLMDENSLFLPADGSQESEAESSPSVDSFADDVELLPEIDNGVQDDCLQKVTTSYDSSIFNGIQGDLDGDQKPVRRLSPAYLLILGGQSHRDEENVRWDNVRGVKPDVERADDGVWDGEDSTLCDES